MRKVSNVETSNLLLTVCHLAGHPCRDPSAVEHDPVAALDDSASIYEASLTLSRVGIVLAGQRPGDPRRDERDFWKCSTDPGQPAESAIDIRAQGKLLALDFRDRVLNIGLIFTDPSFDATR